MTYSKLAGAGVGIAACLFILQRLRKEVAPFFTSHELAKLDLDGDSLVKNGFSMQKVEALGAVDLVVIGSGLSGLTVAAMLARHGLKVLVLEQHDQAGGNCHTFPKKCKLNGQDVELEFDTGVHYLGGQLDIPTSSMRKLYDYVTGGIVKWGKLDDVYDVAVCTGEGKTDVAETFNFSADFKETECKLKERFPSGQHGAIEEFFKAADQTAGLAVIGWVVWKLGGPKWAARSFLRYASHTTRNFLMAIKGMTPKLLGVLTYCYGDHGLQPGKSSWVVQALISTHYKGGAFFPKGGPAMIAKAACAVINKCGGAVLVRAPVSNILVNAEGAYGVKMKGDSEIHANCIVSSCGARTTLLRLLAPHDQARVGPVIKALDTHEDVVAQAAGRSSGLEPSICMVCLFVGLDQDDSILKLPRTNFWRFPSWDHDVNIATFMDDSSLPLPGVFVSTSSSKDCDWKRRHPGVSTVQVLAPVKYDWFIQYESSSLQNRGSEYNKVKDQWTGCSNTSTINFPK